MLKSILNLDGAQELNKDEQKKVNGGAPGFGPCGSVGGEHHPNGLAHMYPTICHNTSGKWVNGVCWLCW